MEMDQHSLAQKWLIGPQELILDDSAEFTGEVPLEPASVDSVFEPVERPKRKVVNPTEADRGDVVVLLEELPH